MKKILKKITICITCIALMFNLAMPRVFAYSPINNNRSAYFLNNINEYYLENANNKLYSSSADNSIYWLIDKTTLQNRVYTFYADNLSHYIVDLNVVSEEDFNLAFNNDVSNDNFITNFYDNYYLVDIKHLSDLYMYPSWSNNIGCVVVYKPIPTIFSLNGVVHTFNYGVSNKNTIQLLQTNFDNLRFFIDDDFGELIDGYYQEGFTIGEQAGYNAGYNAGYAKATADIAIGGNETYSAILNEGIEQGIEAGFIEGLNSAFIAGFERGFIDKLDKDSFPYKKALREAPERTDTETYQDGFKAGQLQPTGITWALALFSAMGLFLGVPLLGPNITIGVIVGVPLVLSLIFFVIKLIRG